MASRPTASVRRLSALVLAGAAALGGGESDALPDILAGSLVATERRYVPAAVTVIERADIWRARAHSLDELLDIHVPSLQVVSHFWESDKIGLRGLLSDRDDKYLLLVNGRCMNQLTHRGAYPERDLMLQGDIHRIEVVRGPGAAIYGPGALAGVVDITTETARTFQGGRVVLSGGFIDRYRAAELMYGLPLGQTDGLFLYAGIADVDGATPDDAPMWTGRDEVAGGHAIDGDGAGTPFTNDWNAGFQNRNHYKLFADLSLGLSDLWARYTQGGTSLAWPPFLPAMIAADGADPATLRADPGTSYRQTTIGLDGRLRLAGGVRLLLHGSYQATDFIRYVKWYQAGTADALVLNDAHREDQWLGRLSLSGTPHPDHSLTVGIEAMRGRYGLPVQGWGAPPATVSSMPAPVDSWVYHRVGIVGEDQWIASDLLTCDLSARADLHEQVQPLFSARLAGVLTPTARDTLKLIAARAQRTNLEKEIRLAQISGDQQDQVETLDTAEVRYEREIGDGGGVACGGWYHRMEVIGFSEQVMHSVPVGTQQDIGAEAELHLRGDGWRIGISHGWAQLLDLDLEDPGNQQYISTKPYGSGPRIPRNGR